MIVIAIGFCALVILLILYAAIDAAQRLVRRTLAAFRRAREIVADERQRSAP